MTDTKTAAIYSRVSTDEQAGPDKSSLADQEKRGRAYAAAQGWEVVATFAENYTGTKALGDRPEGARLIAAVEAGEVEAVVVMKLDRLARKATHNLAAFDLIESLGASLAIVTENIDTGTTSGRFFRTMLAGMAEFERDSIVERMGTAKYLRASSGVWAGGVINYGYRLAEDRMSIEVEESEMEAVRRMYALRLAGLSITDTTLTIRTEGYLTRPRAPKKGSPKVARRWTPANIARLIGNAAYKGDGMSYTVRRDPHDPTTAETFTMAAEGIVSAEDWERANDRKGGKRQLFGGHAGDKSRNPYALKRRLYHRHSDGELVPMYASTRSSGRKDGSKVREYLCRDARVRDGRPKSCPGFGVALFQGKPTLATRTKADRVEASTLGYMLGLVTDPAKLRKLQSRHEERRATLDLDVVRSEVEDRLRKLAARRAFLIEQGAMDSEAGRLDRPAMEAALAEVDVEADELRADLANLDEQDAELADITVMLSDILEGPVYGTSGALEVAPKLTEEGETERLAPGWVAALELEVAHALTPGARGSTPPLSPFAIGEAKWLAESLGVAVVLSSGDEATWPTTEIGLDATLKGRGRPTDLGALANVSGQKCESHAFVSAPADHPLMRTPVTRRPSDESWTTTGGCTSRRRFHQGRAGQERVPG